MALEINCDDKIRNIYKTDDGFLVRSSGSVKGHTNFGIEKIGEGLCIEHYNEDGQLHREGGKPARICIGEQDPNPQEYNSRRSEKFKVEEYYINGRLIKEIRKFDSDTPDFEYEYDKNGKLKKKSQS